MNGQDYEQLMLFPGDSHANRSPLPGSAEARKMTVISGRKCLELYKNSTPLGSLVKMCLESSIWHSTRCWLTWQNKVTKANVSLFQLAVSMPRTSETALQFYPTLLANGMGSTGHQMMLKQMVKRGIMTEDERRQMIRGNGGKINPEWAEWLMGYEQQFTKMIPTPTATDYRGGCLARFWTPTRSQNVQVERERERERERTRRGYDGLLRSFIEVSPRGRIGYMNPAWVEWLMGFPIGWTELSV